VIPVHYISSVSVFETLGYFTGKQVIYENESVDISEQYVRLGYSQSKWVAEKMMENARSAGLPVNIYRSGYIMGHSETGVSNTTDHIARYIAGCIEMACAPILQEYASLSPVDQLSRAFCHVALNLQTHGQTFHLCNPHFITVDEIYRKILAAGFPLELLPYAQWKQSLKRAPSSNPLYPLLSLHVHAAPNHSLTLPELYEQNTRFDCSHFLAELHGSGIRINLNTPNLFERWLNDYLRKGLISEAAFNRANTLDCIA
jgi:thioester reductase-like protein